MGQAANSIAPDARDEWRLAAFVLRAPEKFSATASNGAVAFFVVIGSGEKDHRSRDRLSPSPNRGARQNRGKAIETRPAWRAAYETKNENGILQRAKTWIDEAGLHVIRVMKKYTFIGCL